MRVSPDPSQRRLVTLSAGISLILTAGFVWAGNVEAGQDWLPPRAVSLVAPNATLSPGQPRIIEFLLRANGVAANLRWTATPTGTFVPMLSATNGTVSLA